MPIDSNSLEKLLKDYWPTLVEWVGGARDGSQDIVQAAFIKLASEDPPPGNPVAWLFTVSKRLAINERLSQTKRRLRESKTACHHVAASDQVVGFEIRDLLCCLDEREREIVIAKIWGGLTFDEIATAMDDSKATVWRLYQSGISKLKDTYGEL